MKDSPHKLAGISAQGKRYHIVDEDRLREFCLELVPEMRRETERMADIVREMVSLERTKMGLDRVSGTIELGPYQKKRPSDPDLTGFGLIAGRGYRAAGWLGAGDKIKISLLPARTHGSME